MFHITTHAAARFAQRQLDTGQVKYNGHSRMSDLSALSLAKRKGVTLNDLKNKIKAIFTDVSEKKIPAKFARQPDGSIKALIFDRNSDHQFVLAKEGANVTVVSYWNEKSVELRVKKRRIDKIFDNL